MLYPSKNEFVGIQIWLYSSAAENANLLSSTVCVREDNNNACLMVQGNKMNWYEHSDFIYSILTLYSMQFHLWDHLSLGNTLQFIIIHTGFVDMDF